LLNKYTKEGAGRVEDKELLKENSVDVPDDFMDERGTKFND